MSKSAAVPRSFVSETCRGSEERTKHASVRYTRYDLNTYTSIYRVSGRERGGAFGGLYGYLSVMIGVAKRANELTL